MSVVVSVGVAAGPIAVAARSAITVGLGRQVQLSAQKGDFWNAPSPSPKLLAEGFFLASAPKLDRV
jgi:hypothetical protein